MTEEKFQKICQVRDKIIELQTIVSKIENNRAYLDAGVYGGIKLEPECRDYLKAYYAGKLSVLEKEYEEL